MTIVGSSAKISFRSVQLSRSATIIVSFLSQLLYFLFAVSYRCEFHWELVSFRTFFSLDVHGLGLLMWILPLAIAVLSVRFCFLNSLSQFHEPLQ